MKFSLLVLSLFIAVLSNASAREPVPKQQADLATTTLAESGYPSGYTFEGLQSNHEKIFHFNVPRSSLSGGAELILYYQASPDLDHRSTMRVDVNGEPQIIQSLSGNKSRGKLVVPLKRSTIQQHAELTVKVKSTLLISGDRCIDNQLSNHYLYLMPKSSLNMSMKQHAANIQEAWDILPKKVTISLAAKPSEAAYGNALLLVRNLIDDGKQVDLVSLPQLGDMVIADAASLNSALFTRYLADEQLQKKYGVTDIHLPENKDIYLLGLPDRQLMVFSEPFSAESSELLSRSWRKLALGTAYDVVHAEANNPIAFYESIDGQYTLPLKSLGLDLQTHYTSHVTDWHLPLSAPHFSADMVPETLHLEIVSSPSDTAMILQVFLNGILQEVTSLANDGQPHHYTTHLSAHDRKSGFNEIRLTVQSNPDSGDCHILPPAYPIQITGNSYLIASKQVHKPEQFSDLSAWFASGADIYLPQPDPLRPGQALKFIASLASHNNYPLDAERIHFYKKGEPVTPDAPFIILGAAELNVEKAGVHFDKGRIHVMSGKGESLLDVDQLPNITISQLIQTNNTHGLWVVSKEGTPLPTLSPLRLEDNSVAFSDNTGLIFSINPEERELNIIDYPEHQSWFDHLGKYRFWLWALAWLLLTLLVVHLYAMARQHKKSSNTETL